MKITVKNLGILKQAEFETGGLTIICGGNNTGKTYATYALYGFLAFWNEGFRPYLLKKDLIEELFDKGSIKIDLETIKKQSGEIISSACKGYINKLPMVFAASDKYFKSSSFELSLDDTEIKVLEDYSQFIGSKGKPFLSVTKKKGENSLTVSFLSKVEGEETGKEWINQVVSLHILNVVFGYALTLPFIASAERTGAAIFRKELDFSRNRLLDHMSKKENDRNPVALLDKFFDKGYALPVDRDVNFIRFLEDISKDEGSIASQHPEILSSFGDILGGEYKATRDALYFVPFKKNARLKMGESSSSVRSLLDVGFYIQYMSKPGDILMIDEPELNLHPANQRRVARLLARLVNAGIRVFITTHSDYILKEFNTLIMLKHGSRATEHIMEKYGYDEKELLDAAEIRAYIAQEALVKVDGAPRKQKCQTFLPAPIDEYGIEIASFDDTINTMNDIQRELVFGDD